MCRAELFTSKFGAAPVVVLPPICRSSAERTSASTVERLGVMVALMFSEKGDMIEFSHITP